MNFKILSTALLFTLLTTNAFAGFLKEGNFAGKQNLDENVSLLLKPAPGREGSFFGVLIKDSQKVSLYVIDEINSSSYSMTPLEVTADGEIGIVNDDPSLIISSSKNKNGQDIFRLMSANSSNNNGFDGFFEFDGKPSKSSWVSISEGQFKNDNDSIQISQLDQDEREAAIMILTKGMNGTFTLREKFPSMYLINQNKYLATGKEKNQTPSAISIFLERKGLFGAKTLEMLLVDPVKDSNVKTYSKK